MVKTISEALRFGSEQLKNADIESFTLDSLILLCHTLNCDKVYTIVHKNDLISEKDFEKYSLFIETRKKRVPVKYITGVCEFMSLDFTVNEGVLIPRPDTEILVEKAIDDFKGKKDIKILDLCSGSGCIGISLANFLSDSRVTLADISDAAIKVAKENIKRHSLSEQITIIKKNILTEKIDGQFDIITSNPPYINEEDFDKLEDDVKLYEPEIALLSENDEYKFYKRIIDDYSKNLIHGGRMYLEMGYNQSEFLFNYAENSGKFINIEIIKDLNGIDRVLCLEK